MKENLDAAGIVSKVRTASDGSRYGGRPIARGALYLMLQNRIYRGEVVHKGKRRKQLHSMLMEIRLESLSNGRAPVSKMTELYSRFCKSFLAAG